MTDTVPGRTDEPGGIDRASALDHHLAEVSCPLCDRNDFALYVYAPSHYGPERLRVTQCRHCGMIFTNPQSTSYENRVKERGVLDRFFNADRLDKARLLASFHLAYLADHVPGRRILDFGCGEGAFVSQAHQEGWDAVGVDLNEGLIAAANQFWGSTRLFSKTLDELVAEGRTFDAIYTNQVFEHLPRPVELGQTLMKLLVPRGVIYVEVPNAARLREWLHRGETLDPTSHFNHFTVSTLTKLVERIGCTPVYGTGAPGFFKVWRRLNLGTAAIPLAKLCRQILPGVGGGVCAMGQKPA